MKKGKPKFGWGVLLAVVVVGGGTALVVMAGIERSRQAEARNARNKQAADALRSGRIKKVKKTPAQWRKILGSKRYYVLRQKGTERAFTGKYNKHYRKGIYTCGACGLPLFSSLHKFDSGTGWPSYYRPYSAAHVREVADNSYGMRRVEVVCNRCDSHLGHVFNDGPKPTGLRYCINSLALGFKPGAARPPKR